MEPMGHPWCSGIPVPMAVLAATRGHVQYYLSKAQHRKGLPIARISISLSIDAGTFCRIRKTNKVARNNESARNYARNAEERGAYLHEDARASPRMQNVRVKITHVTVAKGSRFGLGSNLSRYCCSRRPDARKRPRDLRSSADQLLRAICFFHSIFAIVTNFFRTPRAKQFG